MFALKWLLMAAGVAMFGTAAGVVAYDVYLAMQFQRLMGSGRPGRPKRRDQAVPSAGRSPQRYSAGRGRPCSWR